MRQLPGGDMFSGMREIVESWRFRRVGEVYAAEREEHLQMCWRYWL